MALYNLYAGLGGGFGGAEYKETIEAKDIDKAYAYAYELACEEYESYEGMYGVISKQDIIDNADEYDINLEEEIDEEEIEAIYLEEREGWIEYYAVLMDEDENEVEVDY